MGIVSFIKRIYSSIRRYYWWKKRRNEIAKQINSSAGELKIILGAGSTVYPDWISTDFPYFDITKDTDWEFFFSKRKPKKLLAEHAIDYLTVEKIEFVFQQAFKYLGPEGRFRIAVLDSYNENLDYIDAVKPSGFDSCRAFHKTFLDVDFLIRKATEAGFKIEPLEYYTKNRVFHQVDFDNEDGYIKRSKKNNFTFPSIPNYTSLIVDLIKN